MYLLQLLFYLSEFFVFFSFWGTVMYMYANEVETKEKQKLPEIKNKLHYPLDHFLSSPEHND